MKSPRPNTTPSNRRSRASIWQIAPPFRYYVLTDDSAQIGISWFDAAHYCDWLSEQEKIPRDQWCYDPKGGVYGPGMKAKDKFWELTGYRLPTQAEWEFACRAGTVTSRYYGASEQLLPHYARFTANSQNHVWPVGTLEPNDLGLFDMLGNAGELCFDLAQRLSKGRRQAFVRTLRRGAVDAAASRVCAWRVIHHGPDTVLSGRRADALSSDSPGFDLGFSIQSELAADRRRTQTAGFWSSNRCRFVLKKTFADHGV